MGNSPPAQTITASLGTLERLPLWSSSIDVSPMSLTADLNRRSILPLAVSLFSPSRFFGFNRVNASLRYESRTSSQVPLRG